jgi:hypothetical protein
VEIAADAGLARDAKRVLGGLPVKAVERDAARAMLPDDADEVYQRGRALGGLHEAFGLQDVAGNAIDGLEAAQGGLGAGANQAPHEKATADQGPNHRTTDEPGAPGDEDPLHSGES